MTRMNEVVGICLHRALRSSVFLGGDVFSGLRTRRRAVRRRRRGGAFASGEQFTRGAGVIRERCSGGPARRAATARLLCSLWLSLGRCSARAVRQLCGPRQRFQKDESTTCTVGALRKQVSSMPPLGSGVLASVLLAASAQIAGRVIRTPTIAIHRRTMAPSARQQLRDTPLVSQVKAQKFMRFCRPRGTPMQPRPQRSP